MNTARLIELYRERYSLILETAKRYAPDPDCVQDIVQQVFIEFAVKGREKNWDLERSVDPLLHQITKNISLMQWRQLQRHSPEKQRELGEYILSLNKDRETFQTFNEQLDALKNCLKRLPEKSRKIIDLHYSSDVPAKEIAQMLNVQDQAVRQALRRIRKKLHDCILSVLKGEAQ